jgi:mRNA interferase HigB
MTVRRNLTNSQQRLLLPYWDQCYSHPVRIIAKRTLRTFWKRYPQAKGPLEAWHQETARANWDAPSAVKAQFRSASVLQGNRVVFNIAGNHYRLIVKINYPYRIVYIRFVGTHTDYNAIDASTI